MFIDYISLLLLNTSAGLFILALFIFKKVYEDLQKAKSWASGFLLSGLISILFGIHMVWNWPLPGSYNVAFGESSVLLGGLFFFGGLSLIFNLGVNSLLIYAVFAGIAAVLIGIRLINLGLTQEPFLSGLGFMLSGLGGILILPAYLSKNEKMRLFLATVLILSSLLWMRVGLKAYWGHLASLKKWTPLIMRER